MMFPCPTDERVRGEGPATRGPRFRTRLAPVVLFGLGLSACAVPGRASNPHPLLSPGPASRPGFEVARDAFAFPNLVRAHHPERTVAFSNYCIVMARAASQFFRFARFAPDQPAVSDAAYTRLVRQVMDGAPWEPPRPPEERVVIPGYADLRAFSAAREAAIKSTFGSSVLSMMHWRTWRVGLPLGSGHQHRVARELREEVDAGRPAPVMITNFPDPDVLNHAILVYDYRVRRDVVEFLAYDPNDPGNSLALHFDPTTRAFWVEPLPYSPPGRVRAFRLYASPLL